MGKWKKNKGAMPCDPKQYVEVRFADGLESIRKAGSFDWSTGRYIATITHYCLHDATPFDYEEPKEYKLLSIGYDRDKGYYAVMIANMVDRITIYSNDKARVAALQAVVLNYMNNEEGA